MAFSIQTNVNSLIAQENLRVNSNFQNRTIQRLTSGYRINQSGDDAAGLAIANKFRSDQAELTQGVRNANDGVAQLQIMDGGISNIGKMLDRLKTLATQSASSTFTGDRTVLNNEYQNLVTEIDRQAQGIGLSTGGHFAQSMGVYIGGGTTAGGAADTANGTVTLDLSNSLVDSKGLGLRTSDYEVKTKTGTDIGSGSATSVAAIVGNAQNGVTATFSLSGAGFSGISISADLTGVTDPKAVADKINSAIAMMANSNSSFRDANVSASISTADDGSKSLVFSSSDSAFQVLATTKTANALLGNFKTGATTATEGADVGGVYTAAAMTTANAAETVALRVYIDGVKHDFSLSLTNQTAGAALLGVVTGATETGGGGKTLAGLGVTVTNATGNKLQFTGPAGKSVEIQASNDVNNFLGLGSWMGTFAATSYATGAGAAVTAAGTAVVEFSVGGGDKIAVQLSDTNSLATVASDITTAVSNNAALKGAQITATAGDATHITISSGNGTAFRVNLASRSSLTFDMQLGGAANTWGTASAGNMTTLATQSSRVESSGASQTGLGSASDVFSFKGMRNTGDAQTLSFSALDDDGALQSTSVTLSTAKTNAYTLDDAISAINTQLQTDDTLKNIVAVKELNSAGTAEGIRFISSLGSFNVKVGNATNFSNANPVGMYDGTANAASKQGMEIASSESGALDITTAAGAASAVTALGNAVEKLGSAQAAIGKGQNQLNYAIGLANSQISNFASAESQIRDTDVAAEAANLTKAQVLQQASMAAMAQANSAPQAVLALLRG